MVGLEMILDNQGKDLAIRKVQRFVDPATSQTNDIDPPPYIEPPLPSQKVISDLVVAPPQSVLPSTLDPSVDTPQPSVSQLHILEKHGPISGTFYIDPRIPSFGFNTKGGKARKKNPPHASFRTRHGSISLILGTTGDTGIASHKANVLVSSRHGDINVKLLPTPPLRPTMGLEIKTRRGDIVLFVPKDFSGAIQLSSNKGCIEFLPAFASQMQIMKQSQKDALVMLGGQRMGETQDVNFCDLESRRGKVVIGLSDVDRYNSASGFWKRLFGHS